MSAISAQSRDVATLLAARAASDGEAPALDEAGRSPLTYRELHERAAHLAGRLDAATAGLGRRPRIGIVLPNGRTMAVTLLGACCAGAAIPFNPALTEPELETGLRDTAVDLLLVGEGAEGAALHAARRLGIPFLAVGRDGAIDGSQNVRRDLPPPAPDDIALVLLTSGSTGRAKAVPLTHRNIMTSANDVCRSIALGPGDRCLAMWEQYHVGGLVDLLLAPLASGGTVICTAGFDALRFYGLLDAARPTWFQAVPTSLNELVALAGRRGIRPRPNSLRLVRSVAAALHPGLMAAAEDLFGVPVIQTFGMTEAGPLITSTRLPPAQRKPGSTGRSCGTELRVVGPDGEPCAAGEEGHIEIRGDNVFAGYENDAAANAAQFRAGWFRTGDTGYLDAEGDLFLTGRTKQLVNRGGEKINPQEVDDALLAIPGIFDAAVFAVPHPTLGEDIAAAVVPGPDGGPGAGDIRRLLAARLAPFKIPGRILFLDRLPRNPVGKIDRLALARSAAAAAAAYAAPRNGLETYLTRLWADELGIERVGIDDDFATLGGDSLSGLRIAMAAGSELGVDILGDAAAQATTVRGMAGRLAALGCSVEGPASSGAQVAPAP